MLAVVGITLSIGSNWAHFPKWSLVVTVSAAVVGAGLTLWGIFGMKDENSPPSSALVRGPFDNSTMMDTTSEAHTLFDGGVRNSFLARIIHRPKQ